MKLYHYDPITKVYAGETEARLDPLESKKQGKDIFLIPAYATPEAPVEPKQDELVIMDKGNWVCVPIPETPEELPHIETPEEIIENSNSSLIHPETKNRKRKRSSYSIQNQRNGYCRII